MSQKGYSLNAKSPGRKSSAREANSWVRVLKRTELSEGAVSAESKRTTYRKERAGSLLVYEVANIR